MHLNPWREEHRQSQLVGSGHRKGSWSQGWCLASLLSLFPAKVPDVCPPAELGQADMAKVPGAHEEGLTGTSALDSALALGPEGFSP